MRRHKGIQSARFLNWSVTQQEQGVSARNCVFGRISADLPDIIIAW